MLHGIDLKESKTYIDTEISTQMLIATLFLTTPTQEQWRCTSLGEWINNHGPSRQQNSIWQWHQPDGDTNCSWLCSSSQQARLTTVPLMRQHWENARTWGWGWSTPCITQMETDDVRRVRRRAAHWPHGPSPRLAPERGLEPPDPTVEKVEGAQNIQLPQYVGCFLRAPTWVLPHWDYRGVCRAGPLGVCVGEGGGASNTWHWALGQPSSYLQRPSHSPNQQLCSSADPSRWCCLDRESYQATKRHGGNLNAYYQVEEADLKRLHTVDLSTCRSRGTTDFPCGQKSAYNFRLSKKLH